MWPRWLTDALSGKTSLARAFWVYGVGVSVLYSLLGLLVDEANVAALAAYLAVGLGLGVVQTIILWRCARNSRHRFLGGLIRALTIIGIVLTAIVLYLFLMNPGLITGFAGL